MAWQYSVANHRYVSDEGRVLTDAELLSLRNAVADGMGEESAGLATQLVSGAMTLLEWAASFARLIADGLTAAFLLGRGGAASMDATANTTLDTLIATQHEYAKGFVSDVAAAINDGSVTEAGVAWQSGLYSGSAVAAFETGRAEAWNVALDAVPGDGSSECGPSCRCELNFDEDENGLPLVYWIAQNDDHTCPTCQERADTWDPLNLATGDEGLAA
jgi:hypothetical protein